MTLLVLGAYLVGVIIGLLATDDRWPGRMTAALLWPLGPLAFLFVTAGLLVVAAVLWPLPALAIGVTAGLAAYLLC
jgi:hypothetical protein